MNIGHMEKLYLVKYGAKNSRVAEVTEFFGIYDVEERKETRRHIVGNASYGWRLFREREYLTELARPTSEFADRFFEQVEEEILTNGSSRDLEETRTSYRLSFEYGPLYDENGHRDGYQACTVIFHKDRPARDYSLVFSGDRYLGRKHKLKPYLQEQLSHLLDTVPVRWYYERHNGDLHELTVAEESICVPSDVGARGVSAYVALVTPSAFSFVAFEKSLQSALDAFADSGCLDYVQVDEVDAREVEEEYGEVGAAGYARLGNASEPFDLNYCHFFEAEHVGNGILKEKNSRR